MSGKDNFTFVEGAPDHWENVLKTNPNPALICRFIWDVTLAEAKQIGLAQLIKSEKTEGLLFIDKDNTWPIYNPDGKLADITEATKQWQQFVQEFKERQND